MTKIASVDVGSNSVLMCVGEHLATSDFRVIYDMARTTGLGSGLLVTEKPDDACVGGLRLRLVL